MIRKWSRRFTLVCFAVTVFDLQLIAAHQDKSSTENDEVVFAGKVLNLEGQPVAGAKIHLAGDQRTLEFRERTVTGKDGDFRLSIRRRDIDQQRTHLFSEPPELSVRIGAFADGYGSTSAQWIKPEERENLTLWLPAEEIARGRVLNEDGQPVAGVKVSAYLIHGGRLDKDRKPLPYDAPNQKDQMLLDVIPSGNGRQMGISDAKGEVELRGLSRDWRYHLHVSGDKVVSLEDFLVARSQKPQPFGRQFPGRRPTMTHGNDFQLEVEPCKPIIGVVREKGSGKPLSGVEIIRPADHGINPYPTVRTTSDANGSYKLTGVPHGAHRLRVYPPKNTPFIHSEVTVHALQAGFEPVTEDIELARQPSVSGKLTDPTTGKAVQGHVYYFPMASNLNLADNPALREMRLGNYGEIAVAESDGRFLLPVLSGPGVVLARATADYLPAGLAKEHRVEGMVRPDDPEVINCLPFPVWPGDYHAYQFVNITSDKTSEIDFKFIAGRSRQLVIEFPDGNATDVSVTGVKGSLYYPGRTAVTGMAENESRRVIALTRDGRLTATAVVKGQEAGPVTLQLQPTGTIIGRVVNKGGKPIAGAGFRTLYFVDDDKAPTVFGTKGSLDLLPTPAESRRRQLTTGFDDPLRKRGSRIDRTDNDGRFRLEGILPNFRFEVELLLIAPSGRLTGESTIAKPTVKSGETLDLGDITIDD